MRRFRHFRARYQLMSQLADLNSFGIKKLLRTVPDEMTELITRAQTMEVALNGIMRILHLSGASRIRRTCGLSNNETGTESQARVHPKRHP